ncbi:DMT family transporter [Lacticaseibacillus porcinae]|uniref:DMT family transporter n=1 Tax=Lacticaseibacillus porcinae TaxID=1123687 RepID=UPI000F76BAB7|nr:DMT family transporter [Lacticaseibacillus porcinae]
MLPIVIGLVIGFGLPIQTSINSRLKEAFGSPFWSSLISFAIGTVGLAAVVLLHRQSLFPTVTTISSLPWWIWLGGLFGVIYLTSNILLFPQLGAVQTVIFPVLGQILMGLLIDNGGWFQTAQNPVTAMRAIGALLVIAGVLVTVALPAYFARREEFGNTTQKSSVGLWLWRGWGVIAGMLSASQTAVNGRLGVVLGSAQQAALISFAMGTVALLLIVVILHPQITFKETRRDHRWWMWIGGLIGACFVLGNAYLAPTIGTGLAVVIVLLGLMAGSLAIDQFGWLGAKRNPVSGLQLIGLAVMILGVACIRLL